MNAIVQRCGSCSHFNRVTVDLQGPGQCRRYPPTPFPIPTNQGLQIVSEFPPTKPDNNCGEFAKVNRGMDLEKQKFAVSQANDG